VRYPTALSNLNISSTITPNSMNEFSLQQRHSRELELFPHIHEFSLIKNNTIQLDSFSISVSKTLQIYCVIDGKFNWRINHSDYTLYPGDIALILPGQSIGGANGFLDIGTIFKLAVGIDKLDPDSELKPGRWSNLSSGECNTIGKILAFSNTPVLSVREAAETLHGMHVEIQNREIGFVTRVNNFIDSLLISIARQSTRQANGDRNFSRTFVKLEQALREDLTRQWTVEEMAALFGLGTTAFTEKVRAHTGFSPMNYLINIRISEAMKLLKQPGVTFTNIALETGFYSSQHFSTTFKKLTGYTPGQFRKTDLSNPNRYLS
jgi:AraC-like DNA-binding protein